MKKRGFTLIELLAVIVILAIIALIATPIIMNVIEKSRQGAAERSAENYMDAVETAVTSQRIDGNVLDGEYTIQTDGSLCEGANVTNCEKPIKIEMSGNKPSGGSIFIDNGIVTTDSNMTMGDYTISYDSEKNAYVASKTDDMAICTYVDSADDTGDKVNSIDLSDVVTCGTEKFYVMENNTSTNKITMLSMYNLNVGDNAYPDGKLGIQHPEAQGNVLPAGGGPSVPTYGEVSFSTTNYYNDSVTTQVAFVYGDYKNAEGQQQNNIYPYVNAYEEHLVNKLKLTGASATLMSYEQARDLGCNGTVSYSITCSSAPEWFSSTSYWLGSVYDHSYPSKNLGHYAVTKTMQKIGASNGYMVQYYGVRPVVTISSDLVK